MFCCLISSNIHLVCCALSVKISKMLNYEKKKYKRNKFGEKLRMLAKNQ